MLSDPRVNSIKIDKLGFHPIDRGNWASSFGIHYTVMYTSTRSDAFGIRFPLREDKIPQLDIFNIRSNNKVIELGSEATRSGAKGTQLDIRRESFV